MTTHQREHYWHQQLTHWVDSGLSGAAFCKQHALSYHQFTYWRRKQLDAEATPGHPTAPAGFARVAALAPSQRPGAAELTLTLPNGITITGLHTDNVVLLGALLRQL